LVDGATHNNSMRMGNAEYRERCGDVRLGATEPGPEQQAQGGKGSAKLYR
jgi:hypothetical protein